MAKRVSPTMKRRWSTPVALLYPGWCSPRSTTSSATIGPPCVSCIARSSNPQDPLCVRNTCSARTSFVLSSSMDTFDNWNWVSWMGPWRRSPSGLGYIACSRQTGLTLEPFELARASRGRSSQYRDVRSVRRRELQRDLQIADEVAPVAGAYFLIRGAQEIDEGCTVATIRTGESIPARSPCELPSLFCHPELRAQQSLRGGGAEANDHLGLQTPRSLRTARDGMR